MPKIVDKAQKRLEIARIALDLLADEGFTVSVSRIAEKAGLSKGSLYVYFESREELILFALKDWTAQMMHFTGGSLESLQEAPERFREYCCLVSEEFVKDPRALKILVTVVQMSFENQELFQENNALAEYFRFFRKVIIGVIEAGVKVGVFVPEIAENPRVTAINILAYLDGIALHYWMGRDFSIEQQVNQFIDRMLGTSTLENPGKTNHENVDTEPHPLLGFAQAMACIYGCRSGDHSDGLGIQPDHPGCKVVDPPA